MFHNTDVHAYSNMIGSAVFCQYWHVSPLSWRLLLTKSDLWPYVFVAIARMFHMAWSLWTWTSVWWVQGTFFTHNDNPMACCSPFVASLNMTNSRLCCPPLLASRNTIYSMACCPLLLADLNTINSLNMMNSRVHYPLFSPPTKRKTTWRAARLLFASLNKMSSKAYC